MAVSIPWNKKEKGNKYDSKNLFGSHYLPSDASGFELKFFHHQTEEQNLVLQAYIQLAAPGFVVFFKKKKNLKMLLIISGL